ncbi:unnamed protein product [Cyprideis torosa]|uniref:Uncharacterized protein n=1 Tax=Cyprideis torosa TaxID=163714 RepID=A0A7R8ZN09_9CRUS|nr:unnamed protein product [Cyprideis torosa]CAG0890353.1 unnamed protein product [Cyprideis torosa]
MKSCAGLMLLGLTLMLLLVATQLDGGVAAKRRPKRSPSLLGLGSSLLGNNLCGSTGLGTGTQGTLVNLLLYNYLLQSLSNSKPAAALTLEQLQQQLQKSTGNQRLSDAVQDNLQGEGKGERAG